MFSQLTGRNFGMQYGTGKGSFLRKQGMLFWDSNTGRHVDLFIGISSLFEFAKFVDLFDNVWFACGIPCHCLISGGGLGKILQYGGGGSDGLVGYLITINGGELGL